MLHMVCETNLLWSYGQPQEAVFGHGRHGLWFSLVVAVSHQLGTEYRIGVTSW